jgi:hypothetical protein
MAKTKKEKSTTLQTKASGEKTVSKKPVEKETPLVKVAARNDGIKKHILRTRMYAELGSNCQKSLLLVQGVCVSLVILIIGIFMKTQ